MKALRHIWQQPFIFATGIAALIHSTWALGTLFSGYAPAVDWTSWDWYEWFVPALLIAFALDVGQISTSSQIRDEGLTFARGFTFLIFAIATYYLQWLYMAVHMPLLEVSEGVTGGHAIFATELRNIAIWLIPALLPISTVSYTFSGSEHKHKFDADDYHPTIEVVQDVPLIEDPEINLLQVENPSFEAKCICGWTRTYDNEDSMRRGLLAHQQKCSIYQQFAEIELQS
ncbi:MAG: hypothetical protein AAFR81_04055 [Chloroflexota bacterium]